MRLIVISNPIWPCTTIGASCFASLLSARKLLAAPCQMRTGRCKHFKSRSMASLGVFSSYPAVAQTEFDWRQPTYSFEWHVQTETVITIIKISLFYGRHSHHHSDSSYKDWFETHITILLHHHHITTNSFQKCQLMFTFAIAFTILLNILHIQIVALRALQLCAI